MSDGLLSSASPARKRIAPLVLAGGVGLLALVETVNALVAPLLAPSDSDWRAAEKTVRAAFHTGDLIVAAPGWSDQVMRLYLGDLVPLPVAGRMDAARFGRVWEISQRGATSAEAAGVVAESQHAGRLTVRLHVRPAAPIHYDFLARWTEARVTRQEPGRAVECRPAGDKFQCPDAGNFVKPDLLEVDATLRRAFSVPAVEGATMVVEFPAVTLGKTLAVASGLHHAWLRKQGDGQVQVRVLVAGRELGVTQAGNRTGWTVVPLDTRTVAGQTLPVRFEISSAKPYARHLAFAAEARD